MEGAPPDPLWSLVLVVLGAVLALGGSLFSDWISARREKRREALRVSREEAQQRRLEAREEAERRRTEARQHAQNASDAIVRLVVESGSTTEPPFDRSVTIDPTMLQRIHSEARLIPDETIRSALLKGAEALLFSLELDSVPHLRTRQANLFDDLQAVVDAYMRHEEPPTKALMWIDELHEQWGKMREHMNSKELWGMARRRGPGDVGSPEVTTEPKVPGRSGVREGFQSNAPSARA